MHMSRDILLATLTVTGSALCWWPATCIQSLDLHGWLPLAPIALLAGLSTTLSGRHWLRFLAASAVGAFVGVCSGFAIWPPSDPIASSFEGFVVVEATIAAVLVSLVACLVGRKIALPNEKLRRAAWIVLFCCVAFGPVILALTPPLVARRVARNDRLAAERFVALKNAVERTMAESGNPGRICDGQALKKHYSGPPISENDWKYIAGNYVKEDGYVLGIWIYCPEPVNYTIDVRPEREQGDGTRRFCSEESGRTGCGIESSSSGYSCTPCKK